MDDLSALADGRIEVLPARWREVAHPALAHLERKLFVDDIGEPPPLDGRRALLRRRRHARDARARRPGDPRARSAAGRRRSRSRSSVPALERWRAPLETGLGALGVPVAVAARSRLAADAVRPRAPRPAPLRLARRRPPRALRLPAHAVLRRAAREGATSSRDACAGARSTRTIASRPRRSRCTAIRSRSSRSCAKRRRRSTACARPPRACSATRTARGAAGERGRAASTCARTRPSTRLLDELEGWVELGGTLDARRRSSLRSNAHGPRRATAGERGTRRGARPSPRAHAQLRGRLRARARGGELPAARHAGSPFLDDDARRALAGGAARASRTRSRATATSSTPRARARRGGSTSCARRRATRARRASRARSGTRSRGSSRPRTCAARRRGGRSRR